ncbi:MAG: hypothetical protein OQJ97_08170 [Rhodospirillales bacterium]|nr:hypothetical protein [Rhodospirillales bacterium]
MSLRKALLGQVDSIKVITCGAVDIAILPASRPLFSDEQKRAGEKYENLQAVREFEQIQTQKLFGLCVSSNSLLSHAPSGRPLWPEGLNGSISHVDGHVAMALETQENFPLLGIDIENMVTGGDVLSAYYDTRDPEATIRFSLQEAAFKCLPEEKQHNLSILDIDVRLARQTKSDGAQFRQVPIKIGDELPTLQGAYRTIFLDGTKYVLSSVCLAPAEMVNIAC